jgi:hypothetical protein
MQRFNRLSDSDEFTVELFDISSLDAEIRADRLCEALLRIFCHYQAEEGGLRPEDAGSLAHGADYLLREFIIGDRRENIFKVAPERIRQFAGNWYITKTLEPNLKELQSILQGTAEFYGFLSGFGLYPAEQTAKVRNFCRDLDYYQQRIDDYWSISEDGFSAWNTACPVEP